MMSRRGPILSPKGKQPTNATVPTSGPGSLRSPPPAPLKHVINDVVVNPIGAGDEDGELDASSLPSTPRAGLASDSFLDGSVVTEVEDEGSEDVDASVSLGQLVSGKASQRSIRKPGLSVANANASESVGFASPPTGVASKVRVLANTGVHLRASSATKSRLSTLAAPTASSASKTTETVGAVTRSTSRSQGVGAVAMASRTPVVVVDSRMKNVKTPNVSKRSSFEIGRAHV